MYVPLQLLSYVKTSCPLAPDFSPQSDYVALSARIVFPREKHGKLHRRNKIDDAGGLTRRWQCAHGHSRVSAEFRAKSVRALAAALVWRNRIRKCPVMRFSQWVTNVFYKHRKSAKNIFKSTWYAQLKHGLRFLWNNDPSPRFCWTQIIFFFSAEKCFICEKELISLFPCAGILNYYVTKRNKKAKKCILNLYSIYNWSQWKHIFYFSIVLKRSIYANLCEIRYHL